MARLRYKLSCPSEIFGKEFQIFISWQVDFSYRCSLYRSRTRVGGPNFPWGHLDRERRSGCVSSCRVEIVGPQATPGTEESLSRSPELDGGPRGRAPFASGPGKGSESSFPHRNTAAQVYFADNAGPKRINGSG